MDPNANLKEQAELLAALRTGRSSSVAVFACDLQVSPATWDTCGRGSLRADFNAERRSDRARLAELRAALMDWLQGGGFAPDWGRYPAAAQYYGIHVPFGGTVGADYRHKATR
jgi:hypothetical protein